MPGRRKYTSTKLQMAESGHRRAEQEALHLRERLDDNDKKFEAMQRQMDEMKKMLLSSNAARSEGDNSGAGSFAAENMPVNHEVNNRRAALSQRITEDEIYNMSNPPSQERDLAEEHINIDEEIINRRTTLSQKRSLALSQKRCSEVGKEVILYSVTPPYDVPVAKGTIQSTERNATVAVTRLDVECYAIVVDCVMERDAMLPRTYDDVNFMGNAHGRCIAWPR